MKKFILVGCLCSVSLLFFLACQKLSPTPPQPATTQYEGPEISGPLLAQVSEWRIGLDDFEKRLKILEPLAQQQGLDINNPEFKRRVLNELVRAALLAEEAKARGLDTDRDVLEAFESYKQTLLSQKVIQEVTRGINVTQVEIDNFYEQNKQQYFMKPAEVKVREIAVSTKTEAQNIYIKLLQGDSFISLAQIYSTADSAQQGGDLGYISFDPDKKFQKFWQIVFTLDEGETSNIFKGDDGKYYIVKIEDKKESIATPLSEVVEDIRTALRVQKENAAIEELVDSAKQKFKVTINEDLINN